MNPEQVTLSRHIDLYFKALELAAYSEYSTRVGVVVSKGRKIKCGAFNTLRNPSQNVPYGEATFHAEINAIKMLPLGKGRCTMYIGRIGRSGLSLPSRPCKQCMRAIIDFLDFDEIVYLDKFNKIVLEKLP